MLSLRHCTLLNLSLLQPVKVEADSLGIVWFWENERKVTSAGAD